MNKWLTAFGWALMCMFLLAGCSSDEEKMLEHFKKGQAYYDQKQYKAAVIELKNAIQINPEFIIGHIKLGATYIELKEFSSAYQQYAKVVRLEPSNEHALLKLAIFDLKSQRYAQSRHHVDVLLSRQPNHLEALYVLARLEQVGHHPEKAEARYRRILQIDHRQGPAFLGLAGLNIERDVLDQAEGFVKRFLDWLNNKEETGGAAEQDGPLAFKPRFTETVNKLVAAHLARHDASSALMACDRLLAHPGNCDHIQTALYHAKGRLHMAQNRTDLAESDFRMAIARDSGHRASCSALAAIFAGRNAPEKAIGLYCDAVEANPDRVELWYDLAVLYDTQSRHGLAEQHYRRALEIRPDYVPAANNLAYLLAKKEIHLDDALKLAQRAVSKEPANPALQHTLGLVYLKRGEYDNAIAAFQNSLDGLPDHAIVYYHLGAAQYLANRKDAAAASLSKALALDPNAPEAVMARQQLAALGHTQIQ